MKQRPEECQVALAEMMDVQEREARRYRHQSIGPKTFFCATRSSLHRSSICTFGRSAIFLRRYGRLDQITACRVDQKRILTIANMNADYLEVL